MEKIVLKASKRESTGKSVCKKLRKEGFVPAVIYKGGGKALSIYVNDREIWHALHTSAGENAIITLDISDGKKKETKTVLVQETQIDPLKDTLVHVDFHEISLTEKVRVQVPVQVKGEAPGVKEENGVLNQVLWEVEVECMAMSIPEHIEIKVDELHIGDAIHISDLALAEGITIHEDPEQVVVSVTTPHFEEEAVEPAAEGSETEEPELIKKGKKEEEGEEGSEESSEA